MTILPRHQTKTEFALHVLRGKINRGELQPGQRVRVAELQGELGMSPTPIREALRLLQADGVVKYRPHQQIVVAESSPEVTNEIYRLRAVLEPLATELAVPLLTGRRLKELERLHAKLLESVEREASIGSINASWHWAIYAASASSYLTDFIRRLWERFPWRTMWVMPDRAHLSAAEHTRVMEAIRAGDAGLAAKRLRAHVQSGRETLLAEMRQRRSEASDGSERWSGRG